LYGNKGAAGAAGGPSAWTSFTRGERSRTDKASNPTSRPIPGKVSGVKERDNLRVPHHLHAVRRQHRDRGPRDQLGDSSAPAADLRDVAETERSRRGQEVDP